MESIIKQIGEDSIQDVESYINEESKILVRYSKDYLSDMNKILTKSQSFQQYENQLQEAINQLQKSAVQLQDAQLDLLNLNQTALRESRKKQRKEGTLDNDLKKEYRTAIEKVKVVQTAQKNLQNAYLTILNNKKKRRSKDRYAQKAVVRTEKYQKDIFSILNENIHSQTVMQLEGQVFSIVNMEIAVKKLFYLDERGGGKGMATSFTPRIRDLPKSLLREDIDKEKLLKEYGLKKLMVNGSARELMQNFINADAERGKIVGPGKGKGIAVQRSIDSQEYTAWTRRKNGDYYKITILNSGDLSEIYNANVILKGGNPEDMYEFLTATQVDNISGVLVGDFRQTTIEGITTEFSSKSSKASYTIIDQMQNLARQIIGLAEAKKDIKSILAEEYAKQAKASSSTNGRVMVEKILEEKIPKNILSIL